MRRSSVLFVGFLLVVAAAGSHAQGRRPPLPSNPIQAIADGRPVRDVELVLVENVSCLSLRDVRRLVGGHVSWRRLSREISLERDGRSTTFTLDESTAVVNGRPVALETPVRWWTGDAYIPLSFVLTPAFQSFSGATLFWDPGQKLLAAAPVPDISSPHFSASAVRTRVSFDVTPRVDYRVLKDAEGILVLRFFGGRAKERERLDVQDPFITAVDVLPRLHSTDVALYFGEKAGRPRVFLEDAPRRVVVEAAPADATGPHETASGGLPAPDSQAPVWDAPVLLPAPAAPAPGLKDRGLSRSTPASKGPSAAVAALSPVHVIVVDPGHGGRDVGAVGRRGTLEKDVNLTVAKALAAALRAEGRYEVYLTRTSDDFVSLGERAKFADRVHADLFISIHCNAALTPRSNGFEVYFLSEKSTDDAAAAVARRENASLELEGPADKVQAEVEGLFWSLARTKDLNESSEVAALVCRHARDRLAVAPRGAKQAGFYVLKWARMPAILVESAFITNPKEEKLLRSSRYLDELVKCVAAGVRDYEARKVQARLGKNGTGEGS
jgi:N-acetylmuramoyl-L-alanine amidase